MTYLLKFLDLFTQFISITLRIILHEKKVKYNLYLKPTEHIQYLFYFFFLMLKSLKRYIKKRHFFLQHIEFISKTRLLYLLR